MTDAPQKTPKKKASRRFDAKDPVINDIYQQVMEKMFQDKTILKPFEYDFNETTDTHTLTYEDFLRFVKQDKNRRIDVYIKDQVGEWVDVNVSSDFQNGYQMRFIRRNVEIGLLHICLPCRQIVVAKHSGIKVRRAHA